MPRDPIGNPAVDLARDSSGDSDVWGWALGWAYGAAETLYDADPNMVPAELEYRPSMAGPETPNRTYGDTGERLDQSDVPHETLETFAWLHELEYDTEAQQYVVPEVLPYWHTDEFRRKADQLRQACLIWHRYLNLCKLAGLDY